MIAFLQENIVFVVSTLLVAGLIAVSSASQTTRDSSAAASASVPAADTGVSATVSAPTTNTIRTKPSIKGVQGDDDFDD
jgi:hypothetical protein